MGTSHSVVTALQSVLRQCGLKIATKTLEGFVKEIDHIGPWYACSGSLTIASWEKLKGDLVREQQKGKLKAGIMLLWKLVKSCLTDEDCQQMVEDKVWATEGRAGKVTQALGGVHKIVSGSQTLDS